VVGGCLRALAVALFIAVGWYRSADFVGVLMLAAIWAVAALGLGLALGGAGQMWFCQASFVLVGAYVYGWLAGEQGLPTSIALVAAFGVGGAVALMASPILRTRGFELALASIALGLLIEQLLESGNWLPGGNSGLGGIPPLALGPIELTSDRGYLVFSTLLLALGVAVLHRLFGVGARQRAIQAIHHDEDLLGALGGDAVGLKRRLLTIAGALGGLAGGLYAGAFGFVQPDGFGISESFALALAVLIGGGGRLLGAVLGAVIYELAFVVLDTGAANYRFALLGAIVIATVHFFPRGLLPCRSDFAGWFPPRPRPGDRDHGPAEPVEPLALSLADVTKCYGALHVVDKLSLELRPGSLVALVGPNGAGKTTTLDLITAQQAVTDGRLRFAAVDVTDSPPVERARLGSSRTFQDVRLIAGLSVLDNVLLGADLDAARNNGLPERTRCARARDALAEVGLADFEDATVGSLSFAERRFVEMARVLASRPRLALLDEPSSALTAAEAATLARIVQRLHRRGTTVLLVEHNLPFVQSLAQEVIALDQGRLLAHDSTDAVFASPAFRQAYLGAAA